VCVYPSINVYFVSKNMFEDPGVIETSALSVNPLLRPLLNHTVTLDTCKIRGVANRSDATQVWRFHPLANDPIEVASDSFRGVANRSDASNDREFSPPSKRSNLSSVGSFRGVANQSDASNDREFHPLANHPIVVASDSFATPLNNPTLLRIEV